MGTDWELAWAFARQARSELEAREVLIRCSVHLPLCHQLHLLQMVCEKLCKAHLSIGVEAVKQTHSCIAGTLPDILDFQLKLDKTKDSKRRFLRKRFRHIAKEIEYLSPSVNRDGKRPDNSEYPWKDALGNVVVPIDFNFGNLNLEQDPGPQFLSVLRRAAIRLERELENKAVRGT